jgi:hypothetical protein
MELIAARPRALISSTSRPELGRCGSVTDVAWPASRLLVTEAPRLRGRPFQRSERSAPARTALTVTRTLLFAVSTSEIGFPAQDFGTSNEA